MNGSTILGYIFLTLLKLRLVASDTADLGTSHVGWGVDVCCTVSILKGVWRDACRG